PVAILLAAALLPAAAAASRPSGEWVDATLDLAQPDLRNLTVSGSFAIHELQIDGVATSAKDMATTYSAGNAQERADLVGKIEAQARSDFDAALASAFPAASRVVQPALVDTSTLDPSAFGSDAYTPPVKLTIAANLTRTSSQ